MNRSSTNPAGDRLRLLITAGPTHEPIDQVRYVGNRSSGRMGIALAEQAAARGWKTTLLLGPTQLAPAPESSSQMAVVRFQTAAELHQLLTEHWPEHDVLLMAAAVADYRPVGRQPSRPTDSRPPTANSPSKLRRTGQELTLTLEPTPDLLASLAEHTRDDQTVIGFALEPSDQLIPSAKEKLLRKRLDAIIANPLETMDSSNVTAKLLLRDGRVIEAPAGLLKSTFAAWLLDQLGVIMGTKHAAARPR
jgi:phosphopantothenoylcysteine decarboxylase / phosphopantothenate---cysteine ligase